MTDHRFAEGAAGFAPGPSVGIVGPRAIALVDSDPRSRFAKDLWSVISAGGEFAQITEVLISHGLASLPPVAIAHLDRTGVRVLVRGTMGVHLRTPDDAPDVELDAPNVTTWIEHVEPRVDHVALFDRGDLAEVGPFRTTGGVVPAARIEAELRTSVSAGADPFGGASHADHDELIDAPDAGGPREATPPGHLLVEPIGPAQPAQPAEPAELAEPVEGGEPPVPADPATADPETWIPPRFSDASSASTGADDADPDVGAVVRSSSAAAGTEARDEIVDVDRGNETVRFDEDAIGSAELANDAEGAADHQLVADIAAAGVEPAPDAAPEVFEPDAVGPLDAVGSDHGTADEAEDDYDHLFGATQYRSVSSAGVSEADSAGSAGSSVGDPTDDGVIASIPSAVEVDDAAAGPLGDHDGMTIGLAQLRALHAGGAGHDANRPSPAATSATVHAVVCPSGHYNPPSAATCRVCGVEIPVQAHVSVPRPVLGSFRFSTGEQRQVFRPMLLGRSPTTDGTLGGELPELVSLPSPSKELSATHLEVRIEGWQVVVVDRRSTNGTTVCLPQRDPQRLHPGEPFPIVPGTVVDMAEEIQFTFEVQP